MKYLMIGSDPECFLRDNSGNLVSALNILPGSKATPFKTEFGSVQPDNILAEFNSIPSTSVEDFIKNHRLIIHDLESIIKPLGLNLDFVASALANDELLSDPRAMEAGCDPDYDVWNEAIQEKPDYSSTNLRAAGGHLHISFDQAAGGDSDAMFKMVKSLDLVLGLPSTILDTDTSRRQFYGKAGSFRPKYKGEGDPYDGVEYRTLSNFWLRSDDLMAFVFKGVQRCHAELSELAELAESVKTDLIRIINTGDSLSARSLCKEAGISYAA